MVLQSFSRSGPAFGPPRVAADTKPPPIPLRLPPPLLKPPLLSTSFQSARCHYLWNADVLSS